MLTKGELHDKANAMRRKPTRHEKIFRDRLDLLNRSYRTQQVIGYYIVDFVVGNTIIEIDGDSHSEDKAILYDQRRTEYLRAQGYTVVRIQNCEAATVEIGRLLKSSKPKPKKHIQDYKGGFVDKKKLRNITSKDAIFKKLNWNSQKLIMQRERLYGC
jgi:very-short-patch-repair endonuclease